MKKIYKSDSQFTIHDSILKALCIVYCALCIMHLSCTAQTMVLSVDRGKDSIPSTRGPNLKHFGCIFLGGGFVASQDEAGARIKYGSSGEFFYGYRAKYKISPVYSLGWELLIRW